MTSRDVWVEAVARALGKGEDGDEWRWWLPRAEVAVTTVEPLIRADEEKRGAQAESIRYRDAEAVAARLVEVICEDDLWRELLEAKLDRISLMWRAACKERDAARAGVAALREQIRRGSISQAIDSGLVNRPLKGAALIEEASNG